MSLGFIALVSISNPAATAVLYVCLSNADVVSCHDQPFETWLYGVISQNFIWLILVTFTFSTYCRYGAQSLYTESDDSEKVARALIAELRTEQFDRPDDEHTQVSISHNDWTLSVSVFGKVTLQDLSWITGSQSDDPNNAKQMVGDLHMRDVPDERLIALMVSLAQGNIEGVRSAKWLTADELPPYKRAFYRS